MSTTLLLFRQDLRLADNPALTEAAKHGKVLAAYILDNNAAGPWVMGGASRWWLHHALTALNKDLGGALHVATGDTLKIVDDLIARHNITVVMWNRCYEPWRIKHDTTLKQHLKTCGIDAQSFNASLLWEPWDVLKSDETPYKVFTPYYRKGCLSAAAPRTPLPAPQKLDLLPRDKDAPRIADLELLPTLGWDKQMEPHWQISESGAHQRWQDFLKDGFAGYKEGRNFPTQNNVSRLSPYLHFGHISPHQLWHSLHNRSVASALPPHDVDCFLSELGWREFSYYLLYHFPDLPHKNFQPKFDAFPWHANKEALKAWQKGRTGFPIIDAGMRELWQTGIMHNRVRMIVASFLIKNLMIDWREGAAWFWDCLVDADLASNSASWQWVAGSGADAAPYFRIFNPVGQSEKFNAAAYIRRFVPELAKLSDDAIHTPWTAPNDVLKKAGVTLGITYPKPIIDLAATRQRALDAYKNLRSEN